MLLLDAKTIFRYNLQILMIVFLNFQDQPIMSIKEIDVSVGSESQGQIQHNLFRCDFCFGVISKRKEGEMDGKS